MPKVYNAEDFKKLGEEMVDAFPPIRRRPNGILTDCLEEMDGFGVTLQEFTCTKRNPPSQQRLINDALEAAFKMRPKSKTHAFNMLRQIRNEMARVKYGSPTVKSLGRVARFCPTMGGDA